MDITSAFLPDDRPELDKDEIIKYILLENDPYQATILKGSGSTSSIVCPLHGWTYDTSGKLVGAPHFDPCPNTSLRKFQTQEWNGLVFEKNAFDIVSNLKQMRLANHFNFDGYVFHSRMTHECNYNWKTFIEVYLDDYHVDPFHPGPPIKVINP